ncbi:hypothetical protein B566_EDAN017495, partial [Ephemera danica]
MLEASDEESLECVCKLLTTIGKELETRVEKKIKVDLSRHFQRMQSIVDARKTSSRIRFMLQDVMELRANKWQPRRGDLNPKTMGEIAKEAERETLTQLAATPPPQSQPGGGGRISTPRGPLQINKLKVEPENVFGSKNQFTNWSRGSGGSKSKPEMVAPPAAIPFSYLSLDSEEPVPPSSVRKLEMSSVTPSSETKGKSASREAPSGGEVQ